MLYFLELAWFIFNRRSRKSELLQWLFFTIFYERRFSHFEPIHKNVTGKICKTFLSFPAFWEKSEFGRP